MGIDNTKSLLVTISDKNYLDKSKQLFNTIINRSFWLHDLMLITDDSVEDNDLKWFYSKGILVKKYPYFYSEKDWYETLPIGVLHPIVCSKVYLFTKEFKIWDKILYIDSDIILRGPLNNLTKIKTFGAVKNSYNQYLHMQFGQNNTIIYSELKKNYNIFSNAFNAGVFCFDTNQIEGNIKEKFKFLYEKYSSISTYSEQSILNLIFYKKWESLPSYYNYSLYKDINSYNINPKKVVSIVLHFSGHNKPWKKDSPFFKEWNQVKGIEKLENSAQIDIIGTEFYVKYYMYLTSILSKKIFSFNFKNLFRFILRNYFPRLFIYIKKYLYVKN